MSIFFDKRTEQTMKVHTFDSGEKWLVRKATNGEWITVRKLTDEDREALGLEVDDE